MTTSSTSEACCPECGRALPRDAALGLCPACVWSGLALDSAQQLSIPGLVLKEEIARGGMGIVYRGVETEVGREVAVKMLLPALADTPGMRERFRQEAQAVGALNHPGILPVYRVGEHDGLPYFTMKLATGGTLAGRRAEYAGKWRAIAELLAQIADAVHHAHQHGLLHRDLKPGNILLDENGRACVSDFGLVKIAGADSTLTRSVALLGTPHYLAPEVANRDARAASVASDVWSLGAMLYELMAGRVPFAAEGVAALLRQITEESPPAIPGAPRDLATIAFKCLAKEPSARYVSAVEVADDLRAWLAGRPIAARPATRIERLSAWARRNPALAILTVALVLSIVVGVYISWRKTQRLDQALTAALAQAQASRQVGRPGQRQQTLDALAQIAALRPGADVREQAITALALPDVRELRRLPVVDGRAPFVDADFRRYLALEADGRLRVRDLANDRELSVVPEFGGKVVAVHGFSSNGQIAIFATEGPMLHAWHADRNEWLAHFAPDVWRAVLAPDSAQVVLATRNRDTLIVRDLAAPADAPPAATIATGWAGAEPLAWSPDGRRIAVARAYEIQIFDLATGARERTLAHPEKARIYSAAWLPRGNGLAVTTGRFDAYLWEFDAPPPQGVPLRGHELITEAVAFSPAGDLLATVGRDWAVRLWDAATREPLLTLAGGGERLAFSRDGRRLLFQHRGVEQCVVCEVAPSEVCRQLRIPVPSDDNIYGAYSVDFSPDGAKLAVADWGGIYCFDAATATPAGRIACGYSNTNLFATNGALYVAGVSSLGRWKFEGSEARKEWSGALEGPTAKYMRIALSADGSLLAASRSNTIDLFRGESPEPFQTLPAPEGAVFNPIALSPDGKTLVASAANKAGFWVWELPSGKQRARLPVTGPTTFACFSADGGTFWVHDTMELRQFDTATLAVRRSIPRDQPGSGIPLVNRSGDGRLLAAALDTNSVSVFDAASGRMLWRLVHPRPHRIQWIAFDHDGNRLAICVGSHVVQLWDLRVLRERLRALGIDQGEH
jgi:WD40 repeat protein